MSNMLFELRRTGKIDAAVCRFTLWTYYLGVAFGAFCRHLEFFLAAGSFGHHNFNDFGDDVSGPLDNDSVADADVFFYNFIFIVQRRPTDGNSADVDRFH